MEFRPQDALRSPRFVSPLYGHAGITALLAAAVLVEVLNRRSHGCVHLPCRRV
jgi:hypothetical protein